MTTRRPTAGRLATLALTTIMSAGLAAGCGNEAPADSAPELSTQLARVDRAVKAGDETMIRQRVDALVDATQAARDAGQLDDQQADRILAAANALLARLPAETPTPEPSPSPSSSPTTASPSPEEDDEEHEEKPKPEPKPEPAPKPPKPPKDEHDKGKGHKGH